MSLDWATSPESLLEYATYSARVSREDVEVVRQVYEAVARRDAATVLALYSADVEIDSSRLPESGLEGLGHVRGHDGLRSLLRYWSQAWESFEDHCETLSEAGGYVISVVTRRGRGRTSGVETSTPRVGLWTIRDGKIVRVVWFASVDEARSAAGLES
jgi:ketosteroid isomerase-like protein